MMRKRRVELRIVRCLVEYTITQEATEAEINEMLSKPKEPPYLRKFIHFDTDTTRLMSIIDLSGQNVEAEKMTEEEFVHMSTTTDTNSKVPFEELASELARMDMEENYREIIEATVNFQNTKAYQERIRERREFHIERLTKAVQTLMKNQ